MVDVLFVLSNLFVCFYNNLRQSMVQWRSSTLLPGRNGCLQRVSSSSPLSMSLFASSGSWHITHRCVEGLTNWLVLKNRVTNFHTFACITTGNSVGHCLIAIKQFLYVWKSATKWWIQEQWVHWKVKVPSYLMEYNKSLLLRVRVTRLKLLTISIRE